jgi:hypothetical protein
MCNVRGRTPHIQGTQPVLHMLFSGNRSNQACSIHAMLWKRYAGCSVYARGMQLTSRPFLPVGEPHTTPWMSFDVPSLPRRITAMFLNGWMNAHADTSRAGLLILLGRQF